MVEEKIREWEKGSANPIPDSKYERYKEKLVELSKEYPERNLMLFLLARATGYRMQDIITLTVGEIKDALDKGYFEIQEQKQYKQWQSEVVKNPNRRKPKKRVAEIGPSLEKHLKQYLKGKKRSEFAFPSRKGRGNEALTQKSFSDKLKEVGEAIGLEHITGHSPRKTYATKIYSETNGNLEAVRIALGHKSIEETKRYLGLKEQMAKDAARIADTGI